MIAGRPLKRKNGALKSAVLEEDLGDESTLNPSPFHSMAFI